MFYGAVILLGKFMILFMDTGKKEKSGGGVQVVLGEGQGWPIVLRDILVCCQ